MLPGNGLDDTGNLRVIRLFESSQLEQDLSPEMQINILVVGVQGHGPVETGERPFRLAGVVQDQAETVVSEGKIWV